jgi:hypothetical protein
MVVESAFENEDGTKLVTYLHGKGKRKNSKE